jgi:hypothetical protein
LQRALNTRWSDFSKAALPQSTIANYQTPDNLVEKLLTFKPTLAPNPEQKPELGVLAEARKPKPEARFSKPGSQLSGITGAPSSRN